MLDYLDPPSLSDCTVTRTKSRNLVNSYIRRWHSTLPNGSPGFRVAFAMVDKRSQEILGVATWGRPVARALDQVSMMELTRLAVGSRAPRNSCSWMIARMRKWIRGNIPEVKLLISYQDADRHTGGIYRADNWKKEYQEYTSHSWGNREGRRCTERKHRAKWSRAP